ncbi:sensor histidine kinase [uncultured Streptococcus sp.]|uniref:sensor histidine kinase n=1 Tax=uncultured Streptococcus sp. TaxID=83427 RepID=UPI0026587072|nr:sensor histidine kinase [uncultured Streptococcus sp.]
MDKGQFIKYHVRSRLPFYLVFIFNSLILVLFAFLFEEVADILYYALTILTFVSVIMVIWDLSRSYKTSKAAYLYEEITPLGPLEFYLDQALEKARESQRVQTEEERKRYTDLMDYYTLWVHQIKTPIAASQLLLQDVRDSKTKALLEQEVFKIDAYTNLVLQYLRLENFHDDLQLKKVALEPLIKEVVKKHSLFFIQKGLTINLHDLDIKVISDEKWLLVIIEQVLSNSLKYTKSGGIDIYFKENRLYLKDTGIGIKNSDILRVFERGFSGYNGRLTQQSSGLGLYLSKKIADQLGHEISISSQVGQGTTVSIYFQKQKLAIDY